MVCMGFGSCTVSIFSCPTPALGLGGPPFLLVQCTNPNPMYIHTKMRAFQLLQCLSGPLRVGYFEKSTKMTRESSGCLVILLRWDHIPEIMIPVCEAVSFRVTLLAQ